MLVEVDEAEHINRNFWDVDRPSTGNSRWIRLDTLQRVRIDLRSQSPIYSYGACDIRPDQAARHDLFLNSIWHWTWHPETNEITETRRLRS